MNEILTLAQEKVMQDFEFDLAMVETVHDMFPCDGGAGVREPRRPGPKLIPGAETITLAAVYDLAQVRQNRQVRMLESGRFLVDASDLLGV